jgi:hypothetical protein
MERRECCGWWRRECIKRQPPVQARKPLTKGEG